MERYIGMDVHAASCKMAVISEKGRKLKDFPVETNSLSYRISLLIGINQFPDFQDPTFAQETIAFAALLKRWNLRV